MRKVAMLLGLVLVLGASGLFVQRWLIDPGAHGRHERASRGGAEPRWGDNGRGRDARETRGPSGGRNTGPNGLQVAEMVIDILNVVVGVVGIWLAILGMRMHRKGSTSP